MFNNKELAKTLSLGPDEQIIKTGSAVISRFDNFYSPLYSGDLILTNKKLIFTKFGSNWYSLFVNGLLEYFIIKIMKKQKKPENIHSVYALLEIMNIKQGKYFLNKKIIDIILSDNRKQRFFLTEKYETWRDAFMGQGVNCL